MSICAKSLIDIRLQKIRSSYIVCSASASVNGQSEEYRRENSMEVILVEEEEEEKTVHTERKSIK